jgi:hypothetical protein
VRTDKKYIKILSVCTSAGNFTMTPSLHICQLSHQTEVKAKTKSQLLQEINRENPACSKSLGILNKPPWLM